MSCQRWATSSRLPINATPHRGDVRKSMTNGCPSLSDETELSSVGRVRGSVSSLSEDGGDTGAGLLGKLRLLRFPFNHQRA